MAVFYQANQNVTYQYNAAGNINLANVSNRSDFSSLLNRLQSEFDEAARGGALNVSQAEDAKGLLQKAAKEAGQAEPKSASIVDYINGAKSLVEGITATNGLVTALVSAAALAATLF